MAFHQVAQITFRVGHANRFGPESHGVALAIRSRFDFYGFTAQQNFSFDQPLASSFWPVGELFDLLREPWSVSFGKAQCFRL
jgi:hypothetical protein